MKVRDQSDDTRDDLRRRAKCAGPDFEERFHFDPRSEHDRQASIRRRIRGRRHAIHDFLLQHEVHVCNVLPHRQEVEQERRRDVVRQIADESQGLRTPTQARNIELQHIAFMDPQRAIGRYFGTQLANRVAIDFHDIERVDAFEQRQRQRAQAGTDFDDRLSGARIEGIQDPRDDRAIVQEVLAEALTRAHSQDR